MQASSGSMEMWPNPSSHSEAAQLTTEFKVKTEVELRDTDVTRIRLLLWVGIWDLDVYFVLYSFVVSNR